MLIEEELNSLSKHKFYLDYIIYLFFSSSCFIDSTIEVCKFYVYNYYSTKKNKTSQCSALQQFRKLWKDFNKLFSL